MRIRDQRNELVKIILEDGNIEGKISHVGPKKQWIDIQYIQYIQWIDNVREWTCKSTNELKKEIVYNRKKWR